MISLVKLKNNGRKIDQNRANLFKDMLDYCSRADFCFTGLTIMRAKMCRNGYFVQQRLYRIVANPVSIIKFPEVKVLQSLEQSWIITPCCFPLEILSSRRWIDPYGWNLCGQMTMILKNLCRARGPLQ